jgi:hypothetical protein
MSAQERRIALFEFTLISDYFDDPGLLNKIGCHMMLKFLDLAVHLWS